MTEAVEDDSMVEYTSVGAFLFDTLTELCYISEKRQREHIERPGEAKIGSNTRVHHVWHNNRCDGLFFMVSPVQRWNELLL